VQHGSKLRLKKRGATDVDGSNLGDHYIVISVILPKKLTDQQRDAAKMFSEENVDGDNLG
jgi:DnaJ-class molecular chaperone